ncbi:hypothetical protein ACGFYQ_27385 [Streptomyces sp. NPDC048258]|uniref:hypothetical protein n=1 Tax=Streptomyces sp. NPDC048258 TaxID=3365527 RepID=UPI00371F7CE0
MSAKKHTCVLCAAPVKKATGEHALPEQLLKALTIANDGALGESAYDMYAMTYRGAKEQETKRLDKPLSAIRVPCCLSCNQWLNETFEKPAVEHLPKLFGGRTLFTCPREDVAPLSRWLIKTVLMSHHPRVHYSGMTWKAKADFPHSEHMQHIPALLKDLRRSGEVPHSLSLWAVLATRSEPAALHPDPDATFNMGVNVVRPDGVLKLTVTNSKEMSLAHIDGTWPAVGKLWPICTDCASCSDGTDEPR